MNKIKDIISYFFRRNSLVTIKDFNERIKKIAESKGENFYQIRVSYNTDRIRGSYYLFCGYINNYGSVEKESINEVIEGFENKINPPVIIDQGITDLIISEA